MMILIIWISTMFIIRGSALQSSSTCQSFDISQNALTSFKNILSGSFKFCPFQPPYADLSTFLNFVMVTRERVSNVSVYDENVGNKFKNATSVTVIIHGYLDRLQNGWMTRVAQAHANATDGRVLVVDYNAISSCFYTDVALKFIPMIGEFVGALLNGWNIESELVLVGHSLGAHAVGVVGDTLTRKADKIIGLDPAGPLFTSKNNRRLHPQAAKIVQVMHTNPTLFGNPDLLGTVDYFMNDRNREQPNCGSSICSHLRSIEYHFALLFPGAQLDCANDNKTMNEINCRPDIYGDRTHCTGTHTCRSVYKCYPYFRFFS